MDLKQIQDLVKMVNKSNISELTIEEKDIKFSSITSLKPVDAVNGTGAGIVVSTRVPTNIFDFPGSLPPGELSVSNAKQ